MTVTNPRKIEELMELVESGLVKSLKFRLQDPVSPSYLFL